MDKYHQSYYAKNKKKLQEYQRQYYHRKKELQDTDAPNALPPQTIKIRRGEFIISFQ
jgi:hypothetical protein